MLAYADALEMWLADVRPLETETIDVAAAAGRVLSADALADVALPPFDTSAMDGWAIRVAEVGRGGARLPVSARIAAAPGLPEPLRGGTAAKVMTGAPVPPGTEAIVPVEQADDEGEFVVLRAAAAAGDHVRRAGEIFRPRDRLIERGTRLAARQIALLAAGSSGRVEVHRRARVAVVVTGDELVAAGTLPGHGQIRNSNGVFLAAAIREAGGELVAALVAPDDADALRRALDEALAASPDLLVTSGGVSMGDYDLVAGAMSSLGATVLFHRVNIKPAKPVLAARLGGVALLGLPGNPVSVAVSWELFARPLLRAMEGIEPLATLEAELAAPARNRAPRQSFSDARLAAEGARLVVRIVPTKGSHDLLAHAGANALAVLPPESSHEAGSVVRVVPLGSFGVTG